MNHVPWSPTGVYVGCMYQEYASLLTDAGMKLTAATATGNSLAFMVGRVSYTFGLAGERGLLAAAFEMVAPLELPKFVHRKVLTQLASLSTHLSAGPCVSTDTACSSSLVATHLAHTGLERRETVSAVAAGVNLMLSPVTTVAICQLQVSLISPGWLPQAGTGITTVSSTELEPLKLRTCLSPAGPVPGRPLQVF